MKESLLCDKTLHVDFHKTKTSIFSAHTTSLLKILFDRSELSIIRLGAWLERLGAQHYI